MVNVDVEIYPVAEVIGFGKGPEAAGKRGDAVKGKDFDCESEIVGIRVGLRVWVAIGCNKRKSGSTWSGNAQGGVVMREKEEGGEREEEEEREEAPFRCHLSDFSAPWGRVLGLAFWIVVSNKCFVIDASFFVKNKRGDLLISFHQCV